MATLESPRECLGLKTRMKSLGHWRKSGNKGTKISQERKRRGSRWHWKTNWLVGECRVKGQLFVQPRDPFPNRPYLTTSELLLLLSKLPYCIYCSSAIVKEVLYFLKKNCNLWHTATVKLVLGADPFGLAQLISVTIEILTWRTGSHLNLPSQYLG